MVKQVVKSVFHSLNYDLVKIASESSADKKNYLRLFEKYREYTMIPADYFANNLALCHQFKHIEGAVVECGVWRGGMIAGIAELLGNDRKYFLFDSFEGLPAVKEIDGKAAKAWQLDTESPGYHNNCTAEKEFAERAMQLSGVVNCEINQGWFNKTLPGFDATQPIAVLRLDGDWYDSTMDCFQYLYPSVVKGGIIIIDDYYAWDGCSRAVHDYLSTHSLTDRIHQYDNAICFIIKK